MSMNTPKITYVIAAYRNGQVYEVDYLNCEESNKEDELTDYLFENYSVTQIKDKAVRVFLLNNSSEIEFSISIAHPKINLEQE